MREEQGGSIRTFHYTKWSSTFPYDSPAITLNQLAWIEAGSDFYFSCQPGLDRVLLVYTMEGGGEVACRGKSLALHKGDALLIDIMDGYYARSVTKSWKFVWIQMSGTLANSMLSYIKKDCGNVIPISNDILPYCERVYELASRGVWAQPTDIQISCQLYQVLGLLQSTVPQERHTEAAAAYIQAHYMEGITSEALARHCHMSTYHFIRRFKQDFGLSPRKYITAYRMKRAKELLRNTEQPVAVVAASVGFEDSAYFTRVFKQHTGCLPSVFRKFPLSS